MMTSCAHIDAARRGRAVEFMHARCGAGRGRIPVSFVATSDHYLSAALSGLIARLAEGYCLLTEEVRGGRGYFRRPSDGRPPETARTDWERKRAGVAFLIGHSCLTVPDFGS